MSVERTQVPDLMQLGNIPDDLAQEVETDVLDPVVFNQNFCRFTLQNKGFLHSFSRLTFALDLPNASNQGATYPANIGIHSLIDRATLKVGAKTICELEDFNKYMAYKSMFIATDINKERESVLTGRVMYNEFHYNNASGDLNNFDSDGTCLGNGTAIIDELQPAGAEWLPAQSLTNGSFVSTGVQVNDNLLLKNTPVFQIALSDLFPFLRFNQLPLYMMKEQISIELVFSPVSGVERFCVQAGGAGGPDTANQINITQGSVQMVADYIFYDGQMLADYAAANSEMSWNYVDYRLTKRSYIEGASTVQTPQVLNVGGAGRIVNKLIVGMFDDGAGTTGKNVLNGFHSKSASNNTANLNVGQLTTNVRYNDHYLYPIDRTLSAIQFHDVVQTEQNVPYVSRDQYNQEGGGTTGGGLAATFYNGHSCRGPNTGIRGNFCWNAHRLNRNERINSRGIELETLYSALPDANGTGSTFTQRCWIEIVRTATLRDGFMDCYWA